MLILVRKNWVLESIIVILLLVCLCVFSGVLNGVFPGALSGVFPGALSVIALDSFFPRRGLGCEIFFMLNLEIRTSFCTGFLAAPVDILLGLATPLNQIMIPFLSKIAYLAPRRSLLSLDQRLVKNFWVLDCLRSRLIWDNLTLSLANLFRRRAWLYWSIDFLLKRELIWEIEEIALLEKTF